MHQKAKGFFFFSRNKTGFLTYETAHTFSFIKPTNFSTVLFSNQHFIQRPNLTWSDPHLTGAETYETKVSTESGPAYSDFSGVYPVLLSGYCQHFREFINEEQNHLLALNTNKHSTSTEKRFQTQSQRNNLFSAFENWCTRTMISNPDNCLLQILLTQGSWKKWRACISLIGKTWQSPGSELGMQCMSTETAGFSHALCTGYSEETETGPTETVMSWDFLSGMQDYVTTHGILPA